MFMGSHQVVSEHSILGAPKDTTQKRMEPETEELERRLEGVSVMLREIERLWKRRKQEETRRRTRRHHVSSRRSGSSTESNTLKRDEKPIEVDERDAVEEMRDLDFKRKQHPEIEAEMGGISVDKVQKSELVAKSVMQEVNDDARSGRTNGDLLVTLMKPEADKEDEVDEAETRFAEGMVEEEGTDWEGGEADLTFQKEQPPPEPPPELKLSLPPTMVELQPVSDLGERCLSFVAESCNRYWGEAKAEKEINKKGVAVNGLAEKYFKTQFVKSHSNIFEEAELSITFSLYGLRIKGPQNWCSDLVEHLNKSWIHCFNNPLPCKARSNNKPLTVKEVEQFLKEEVIHVDLHKVWQLKVNNITFISELSHGRGGFHQRKKIDCTPYYNFSAWVFRDLNQLMKKRNTMEWTTAPSYQNHAVHVGNFCLEISQLHGKEQVGDLSGKWEIIYDGEDIELPVSEMGQNYPIEVVKIMKLIMGVCSNFCKGFWLLFKGVGKIIKFLVGLGRNCCSGQMQLQNISMKEPLLVHQWDPGGLRQEWWNPCVLKQSMSIQESATCALEGYRNQAHQRENWKTKYEHPILSGEVENINALIGEECEEVIGQLTVEWGELLFLALNRAVITLTLVASGGIFLLLLEYHCLIKGMKIVMIRQVAHEDVEVLKNCNEILLFHNFISHQVIMLVLFVILNCEWGAHKSDDFENITQVWLQTRQEIWVEHLIQELGSSRRPMRETHHKQWDPGEPYLVSCIIGTSCFKLWDPGGRVLIVCFGIFTLRTR